MPRGRKGYGEELRIKESLAEITPKMFAFVREVMSGDDKKMKLEVTMKLLPKIIDKALPSEFDLSGELTIQWLNGNNKEK